MKKIRAFRDLSGMELSLENVRRTIEDMQTVDQGMAVTPGLILRNVCKYYGVDETVLRGPQRSRNISEPRQVAVYLMRKLIRMSQEEIAKEFSRERTTIVHLLKQVETTLQRKGNKLDPILRDLESSIAACF